MNPVTPGLRPLFNKSKSPAKVTIVVQPGDELAVSDNVAAQLGAEFAPVGDTSKADAAAAADEADSAGETPAAQDDDLDDETPAPKKKTAKKAS